MHSNSYTYERGATHMLSHGDNDHSGFQAATSNQGHYDEPQVDVLQNSRRAQLADALGQSASKEQQQQQQRPDYAASQSDFAGNQPDTMIVQHDTSWQEYRQKLEQAVASDAPVLELTIQSSATLIKGEKITINALGLLSHESKRTNPRQGANTGDTASDNNIPGRNSQGEIPSENASDVRDGFVFFGCKKSIKQHQSNLDQEQTTIVS